MDPIFKKLNFKDQEEVYVLEAPEIFRPSMANMAELTQIHEEWPKGNASVNFLVVFVLDQASMEERVAKVLPTLVEDAHFWVAYPKKSSKKYKTDLGRDNGWEQMGAWGYEVVRLIAIDADWSAFRFREPRFIKSMKRSQKMRLSDAGKQRGSE